MLDRMALSTFGDRIQRLRKEKGYSQQFIADHLNVSVSAVSLWEKNRTNITSDKIAKLAEILDCDVEWLLKGSKNEFNHINQYIKNNDNHLLKSTWIDLWDKIQPEIAEDIVRIAMIANLLKEPYRKTLLNTAVDLDKQQSWEALSEDDRENFYNWLKNNKK